MFITLVEVVKVGSNDTTSKIGDKKLRLVSVSSAPPILQTSSSKSSTSAASGIGATGTVDDHVLTPKQTQALAYENGYHSIKDFYKHEIMERNGSVVAPKERDYRKLWNVPEENISFEYETKRAISFIGLKIPLPLGRTKKTVAISSSTLEDIANEKRNTKFYNVQIDYTSRGKLRALIDISLSVLMIDSIEPKDAVFLLKNAYLALYAAVGKIEGVDAKYLANLRNLPELKQEWGRLKGIYPSGGCSEITSLHLPSALVYEAKERTHLTKKPQAEETAAETSTAKGTDK